MSTNHTENYGLSQWEAEDKVLRTDFNEDNAKIDAALGDLTRITELSAYYIGQFGSFIKFRHGAPPRYAYRGFIWDSFEATFESDLTGSATVQNSILSVSGAGNTGSWEVNQILSAPGWTHGWFWIHFKGGTVTPALGNAELSNPTIDYVENPETPGSSISEYCYPFTSLNNQPVYGRSVKVHLDLTAGPDGLLKVYDFNAVFL